MKFRNKFTVLGSIAVLSTTPIVYADEAAVEPQIVECWEGITEFIEEPMIAICPGPYQIDQEVSIDPTIIDEEIFSTGAPTDEVIFENEVTSDEEVIFENEEISDEEVTFENEETSGEEVTFENEETSGEEVTFDDEENIDEEVTTTDGEVNEEVTDGEIADGGEKVDPEVTTDGGGFEIPLDWIKRGDGFNPEIYYSMASGAGPAVTPTVVFRNETSAPIAASEPIARQIGPDSKATAIEGRENSGAFKANRAKKGPVALVKEGRVFLR